MTTTAVDPDADVASWRDPEASVPPHGTAARYRLHLRHRRVDPTHEVCAPCRDAHNRANVAYRRRRATKAQVRAAYASVRQQALEDLARRFPREYEALLDARRQTWLRLARRRLTGADFVAVVEEAYGVAVEVVRER